MNIYRTKGAEKAILDSYDALLAAWGTALTERELPTRYGLTHCVACGDAANQPLVLFHGVGDDAALMWLYNAAELSAHFRLYAIDTLGGPGKSRPNERYGDAFDDVCWLDDVLDALGLAQTCLAGVSHGAYLAQLYALKRPSRVGKIVCMAGGVPVGSGKGTMKTMMKIFMPQALFPCKASAVSLLRKLSGRNSAAFTDHPLMLNHFVALLRGFNNMAMRYHQVTPMTDAEIDCLRDRALYLIGDDDPFAQMGGKASVLAHRMNAKFYPGVGHGINQEIPQQIDAEIVAFLQERV